MPYKTRANPFFESDWERLLKKRPLAGTDINAALKSFAENPKQGDRVPNLGSSEVRKFRWPLKSYRIGSSGGLRFVFAVQEDVKAILPITLWLKKEITNEADVLAHLKTRLKQALQPGTAPEPPASA